jgi:hypothetical protein
MESKIKFLSPIGSRQPNGVKKIQQPEAVGKKKSGKTGSTLSKSLKERLGKRLVIVEHGVHQRLGERPAKDDVHQRLGKRPAKDNVHQRLGKRNPYHELIRQAVEDYEKLYYKGLNETMSFLESNPVDLDEFKPNPKTIRGNDGDQAEKHVVDYVACPSCGENLHYAPAKIPGIDVMCSCFYTGEVKCLTDEYAVFNPKFLMMVLYGTIKTTSVILVKRFKDSAPIAFNISIEGLKSLIQGRRSEIEQMIIDNKTAIEKQKFSVEFSLETLTNLQ